MNSDFFRRYADIIQKAHVYNLQEDAQGLPIGYMKAGISEVTATTNNPFDLPARDPFWNYMTADKSGSPASEKGKINFDIIWKAGLNSTPSMLGKVVYSSNADQPSLSGTLSTWINRQKQSHEINITDPNHPLMKIVQKSVNGLKANSTPKTSNLSSRANKPNNPNYDPNDFSNRK
jgi:hypothetical protein